MSEWQPIETAPKDARRILISDQFGIYIAQWAQDAELGQAKTGPGWQIFSCEDCWYSYVATNPTHWMPLPEPPLHAMDKQQE